jgi:undecaprenyl phosphate N,N'-diacetylbacillosamine 1-phosphate transferase
MTLYRAAKRLLDVLVSTGLLIIAVPVVFVLACLIRADGPGPVFFRQKRIGQNGIPFRITKLRTMNERRDRNGELLSDSQRLTPIGRFMRQTSLDELPQLWNVLKGEMSLVGPRPLLERYMPYYSAREQLRHSVPPGITGLAQVSGRNTVRWDERLEYDAWYAEHASFILDLRILVRTIAALFNRRGVVVVPTDIMQDLDAERARPHA